MSQSGPKGPYIYQPFGRQDREAWMLGRIYGVAGISIVTIIHGLTKEEANAVLAVLAPKVGPYLDPTHLSTDVESTT